LVEVQLYRSTATLTKAAFSGYLQKSGTAATKRFSCSVCGDEAWLTVTERGMEDYRLDQREDPERHPAAVDRLLGRRRRPAVDQSGGELPGRKLDDRRWAAAFGGRGSMTSASSAARRCSRSNALIRCLTGCRTHRDGSFSALPANILRRTGGG
jgi:hypothetical protein